jgi:hypothetical protein
MSTLSPLQSPYFLENKMELRRLQRQDQENLEARRQRDEREIALQKGDLKRQAAELREREQQVAEREAAVQRQQDEQAGVQAVCMARELNTDAVDRAFVTGNSAAVAAQIIAAADKARNPDAYVELPTNPTARAIALAAMKARGERLSAADEDWLARFSMGLANARR